MKMNIDKLWEKFCENQWGESHVPFHERDFYDGAEMFYEFVKSILVEENHK